MRSDTPARPRSRSLGRAPLQRRLLETVTAATDGIRRGAAAAARLGVEGGHVALRLPKRVLLALPLALAGLGIAIFLAGRNTAGDELAHLTPEQRQYLAEIGLDPGEDSPGGGLPAAEFAPDGRPWHAVPAYQLGENAGLLTDENRIFALMNPPDPRIPGLNYLEYITTVPEEAERFQHWLARHRVASIALPSHNDRFVHVIDVTRGFTADELRDRDEVRFLSERRLLGRKWRRHNDGRGDDLSDMYFRKFQPESR